AMFLMFSFFCFNIPIKFNTHANQSLHLSSEANITSQYALNATIWDFDEQCAITISIHCLTYDMLFSALNHHSLSKSIETRFPCKQKIIFINQFVPVRYMVEQISN